MSRGTGNGSTCVLEGSGCCGLGWLGGERKSLKRCKANGVLDEGGWVFGLAMVCEGEFMQLLKESSS